MITKEIDVVLKPEQPNEVSVEQLKKAPDHYFSRINAIHILEYVDEDNILEILVSKLCPGGKLYIKGTDLMEICMLAYTGQADMNSLREFISKAKRAFAFYEIVNYCFNNGLTILNTRTDQSEFYITITRPTNES